MNQGWRRSVSLSSQGESPSSLKGSEVPPPQETSGWVGLGGIQWEGHKQERPKGRKDGDTHRKGLRGGTMAPVSGTGVEAQAMMGGRGKKQPFSVMPLVSAASYHQPGPQDLDASSCDLSHT